MTGYLFKLDRAASLRGDLKKDVDRWLRRHTRARRRLDPASGEHVVRALITEPPPPTFSLLIGDCVHNLRAALDHMAYELVTSSSKVASEEALASVEFPIFRDPGKFSRVDKRGDPARGSGLAKLRYADPAVLPIIESMQPYHGEEWEPLSELHDLDRIDKHRQLHVAVAMSREVEIDCGDNAKLHQFTFEPPGKPVEDGEELCRFVCIHKRGRQGKIKPKAGATFSLALREGTNPWSLPVVEQLASMDRLIRDEVVVRLAPFLRG